MRIGCRDLCRGRRKTGVPVATPKNEKGENYEKNSDDNCSNIDVWLLVYG